VRSRVNALAVYIIVHVLKDLESTPHIVALTEAETSFLGLEHCAALSSEEALRSLFISFIQCGCGMDNCPCSSFIGIDDGDVS
jgi:hypothetical protein